MKNIIRLRLVLMIAFSIFGLLSDINAQQASNQKPTGTSLKVMTYNLKFADPGFKPSWEVRCGMQVDMIKKYNPDIIGTQEGLKGQIDDLMDKLPEYIVVGEGRKGGDDDEHMAIFIKRDRFRIREMGSFQLSETPDIIGSGPKTNPRMVTWLRLAVINRPAKGENSPYPSDYRDHWDNSQEFYIFNTHLFVGNMEKARVSSANLILERIKKCYSFGEWTKNRPVVLTGDFNSRPGSAVYKTLVGDSTTNNPNLLKDSKPGGSGIDWILYNGNLKVVSYENVNYNVDGVYPSDHHPIIVEFLIPVR
jgi:endonuclease/exonuclease/phosphatase family metal-dependent hydrolase